MTTTFPDTQAIPEGSTRKYSAQLVDTDGNAVQAGQVTSIKFSLRDARSNNVLNSRNRVEVRNASGGTISSTGLFTMTFNQSDTAAVGTSRMQKRRALFEVTFTFGTENHEVVFYVQNLSDIPPLLDISGTGGPEGVTLGEAITAVRA